MVQPLMGIEDSGHPFQHLRSTSVLGTPVQGTRRNVVSNKISQIQIDVVSSVLIASRYDPVQVVLTPLLLQTELVSSVAIARRLSCWDGLQAGAFVRGLWKQLTLHR